MAAQVSCAGENGRVVNDVLAAVDIGTNSVHLVVARFSDDGKRFDVVEREREMVRLGSSGGDMTHLDDDAIERGIEVLSRFRQVAEVHGARVRAVATSAVREAENRDEFIDRAWADAGMHVDVISGFEEARLIHLGVLQAVPVFDQQLLLCDIGGGSTELLVGKQGDVLASRSLKLGAIRLTTRFFDTNSLHPGAVDACRRYVRATLAPLVREIRRIGFDVAVGSSGTIAAVCAMVAARRDEAVPRTFNNFVLTRDELAEVLTALVKAGSVKERAKLPGLDERRADIILAGAIILEQVVDELGLDSITYSDYALREGVLLDTWRRMHGGSLHHLSDLRRRSVVHLAELMDDDPDHTGHVARLALALFDGLAERHGLGDDAREYLEAAALLSNVGLFLSHAQHHKHSYYVIRNSEHLAGFTDREIELIALVARYHRKSDPKAKHPEFAALTENDQRLVSTLAGILRVAIGLDRNHAARVRDVAVSNGSKKTVTVEVLAAGDADISLELFAASQRKDLLESVLGTTIELA
jgi:exopolyphosphatase/guanosine-5'-triphosphate,3'-diphosphate pyrophosphatase